MWTTWLALCAQIKVDTRLGVTEKAGLAAQYADASAKAATSGMKGAYREHFLQVLKRLLLAKQL